MIQRLRRSTFVPLKSAYRWPSGITKDKLTAQMNSELSEQFPGVDFNFSQYIQDNVEEAASGVKGENSVKVYGNELATLERTVGTWNRTAPNVGLPRAEYMVDNVKFFATGLNQLGLVAVPQSPIFPVLLGDPVTALAASQALRKRG